MTLPADRKVGPPPDHVIETEVKGDISLFDARTNQVLVLNATASDVWRLCDGAHTIDEIAQLLSAAYGQPTTTIKPDVEASVAQLIAEGCLPALD